MLAAPLLSLRRPSGHATHGTQGLGKLRKANALAVHAIHNQEHSSDPSMPEKAAVLLTGVAATCLVSACSHVLRHALSTWYLSIRITTKQVYSDEIPQLGSKRVPGSRPGM
jgi:hypothetical protein